MYTTLILASSLSLMIALESTAIKYVRGVEKKIVPSEQIIFLVEIAKLIISAIIYKVSQRNYTPISAEDETENGNDQVDEEEDEVTNSSIIWFLLPACLWAVSNNVVFLVLQVMSPAMFNLLMNLKTPLTALFAWSFINYEVTSTLLISFFLLFLGSGVASFNFTSFVLDVNTMGVLGMLVYCSCSAGAAVYSEYVTKIKFQKEDLFLQNVKFCFCSAIVNVGMVTLRWEVPFYKLEWVHLLSIGALAMNGLLTSAVIKYCGSITKTYSVSVAMFISALLTWLVFNVNLAWNFYVGAIICVVAVNLYANERRV